MTETFKYNGDGQRIIATQGVTATVYIGSYFEWHGTPADMVKYYYSGATRVAMRVGATPTVFLMGDHLGSTSVAVDEQGAPVGGSPQLYYAWGETRAGSVPTKYQYTGQFNNTELGLYYYGARWYDAALGRFIQADTIIPLASQGVQAWDRYAYVNNSPVNYADPTGHMLDDGCRTEGCEVTDLLDKIQIEDSIFEKKVNVAILEKYGPKLGRWLNQNVFSSKFFSGEVINPVARGIIFDWAASRAVTGNQNALIDLYIIAGSNLETGMMGLAMGGDVAPVYNPIAFGKLSENVRSGVFTRDNFTCQYCGKIGGPLEIDHIQSKKQVWDEGAYNWTEQERNNWLNNQDNLLTTCRTCNAQKAAMDPFNWFLNLFTGTYGTGKPK